jgi:transcriptional activator of cad operon
MSDTPKTGLRRKAGLRWGAGAVLCSAIVIAFLFHGKVAKNNHSAAPAVAAHPERSIAVLPFLDLTEGMHEEEFADGMTEELIDKFSKIPGLRVPSPTSSFYYKGKRIPVADIAKTLGVAYVLDGSVRKSGARLRVAARLIRADNGYVVWSETYDRALDDLLVVQDDIAGEVTKALRASIEARPDQKGQSPN